jgi:hypothetical protein
VFAIPPAQMPQLHAIVRRAELADGDTHPAFVRITVARRDEADAKLLGASVKTNGWVYVIAMRGRFVARGASWPAGGHAPRGNTVVLLLGRESLRDLDDGIGTNLPLSKLHGWQPLR